MGMCLCVSAIANENYEKTQNKNKEVVSIVFTVLFCAVFV